MLLTMNLLKRLYDAKISAIDNDVSVTTQLVKNNIAAIVKLKTADTNFVNKTKFSADINSLDDKIDKVDKKVPDISGLALKTSLNNYLQTATFNSKVTELEGKITTAEGKIPSVTALATKAEVTAVEIKYLALLH